MSKLNLCLGMLAVLGVVIRGLTFVALLLVNRDKQK